MQEAQFTLIGVLVGAIVSTGVPALVELVKHLGANAQQRRSERRATVRNLLETAYSYDYGVRLEKPGASALDLIHIVTQIQFMSASRSLKDVVIKSMELLLGAPREAAVPLLRELRDTLPAWARGRMLSATAVKRLLAANEAALRKGATYSDGP